MANLPEESRFDEGVYQVELTDPVIGGPNGISNRAQRNLANRTRWLKDRLESALGAKADKDSPGFTGTPTAPAPADSDNSTRLATTGWVHKLVAALAAPRAHVGSRGTAHAEATTSEAGFMSAADKGRLNGLDAQLLAKANRASPEFTGTPTAPTPASSDNSNRLATTSWVKNAVGALSAPLSHVGSRGAAHAEATTTEAGFMSAADKRKLDTVSAGAGAVAVTSVAGRTGAVTLSVADVRDAAPKAGPTFSGSLRVESNTQIDLNETGTVVYVPTKSLSSSSTGDTEAASKRAVLDYAAPKVNASFSGTTNFSGTVVFDAAGDARGRTWPETDNSVSFATTAWVRRAMSDIAAKAGFSLTGSVWTDFNQNTAGRIDFPAWLGGFRIQWVSGRVVDGVTDREGLYSCAVAFPVAFREGYYFSLVSPHPGSGNRFTAGPRPTLNNKTHCYVNMGVHQAHDKRFVVFAIGK